MTLVGTFKDFQNGISSTMVEIIRTTTHIANEDLAFHRSSYPSITVLLDQQNTRLLQLTRRLTESATSETEILTPPFKDIESIDDHWKNIVDVFDDLLEKADICLDEFTGVVRRLSPSQEERLRKAAPSAVKQKPDRSFRSQNIPKPQLLFEKVPRNDDLTIFKPLLRAKPHGKIPLDESIALAPSFNGSLQYKHPYDMEIINLDYPANVYAKADPIPYLPYKDTTATLVDTTQAVTSMIQELKCAREIAVDLEHHDEHSYIGLVSLMQISTRNKDWIIDTLKPWRHELQKLNEVFADPNIIKVFHGAFMDIIWLQRDFGLYVVGLFDTYHASRSMQYSRNGLAHLLKKFANFDATKQYQMADWRIRPLPEEMFNYARSDTHFLLYIYDNLRNELIDKSDLNQPGGDLIKVVLENSKQESLQRYERSLYDEKRGLGSMGWYTLLCRTPTPFNHEQFAVFRAVHQWRDTVAREEDESVHAVMSKTTLYNIATVMPTDIPSLISCANPMSPTFRKSKANILEVLKQAKAEGSRGSHMRELMESPHPLNLEHHKEEAGNKSATVNAAEEATSSRQMRSNNGVSKVEKSLFWGSTILNFSSCKGPSEQLRGETLRLALPLPPPTPSVCKDLVTAEIAESSSLQRASRIISDHGYTKVITSDEEDVCSVEHSASSRKRNLSQTPVPQESMPTTANQVIWSSSLKALDGHDKRKRLRKASKQARTLENSEISQAVVAFDYAKAPSLHGNRDGRIPEGPRENNSEDPYMKSTNAPRGFRKRKLDAEGKSFTFQT